MRLQQIYLIRLLVANFFIYLLLSEGSLSLISMDASHTMTKWVLGNVCPVEIYQPTHKLSHIRAQISLHISTGPSEPLLVAYTEGKFSHVVACMYFSLVCLRLCILETSILTYTSYILMSTCLLTRVGKKKEKEIKILLQSTNLVHGNVCGFLKR